MPARCLLLLLQASAVPGAQPRHRWCLHGQLPATLGRLRAPGAALAAAWPRPRAATQRHLLLEQLPGTWQTLAGHTAAPGGWQMHLPLGVVAGRWQPAWRVPRPAQRLRAPCQVLPWAVAAQMALPKRRQRTPAAAECSSPPPARRGPAHCRRWLHQRWCRSCVLATSPALRAGPPRLPSRLPCATPARSSSCRQSEALLPACPAAPQLAGCCRLPLRALGTGCGRSSPPPRLLLVIGCR